MVQAKKKIITVLQSAPGLFKRYLPHIVFLVFMLQILVLVRNLPYVNIINRYYYYVCGMLWILVNILFKGFITSRKILIAAFVVFILAIPFVILKLDFVSELVGFVFYVLLATYIIRESYALRKELIKKGKR